MKIRIYLRVGKSSTGFLVAVSKTPKIAPFQTGNRVYLPTVNIAFDLDIPNKEFDKSRILLNQKIEETKPCVEIKQIIEEEPKKEEMKEEEK